MSDIVRKLGDTLVIPFTLSATNLPDGSVWAGAICKMNIEDASGTIIIDHGACTFDSGTLQGQFKSTTPPPAGLVVGNYKWEVEVTFADGTILTAPNTKLGNKLKIVDQVN